MREGPRQLPLDLPVEPRFELEDFLLSPSNEEAYAALDRWPDWNDSVAILVGSPGSGKSHLAAIWANKSHAWTISRSELSDMRVPELVSNGALVIEDCDRAQGNEAALFHLLNAARERRCFVLLTASSEPGHWQITTPDLLSRLRLAPIISVHDPDDALLGAILVKMFVDRQVMVDTTVVDLIKMRAERSIASIRDIVVRIDKEGLARGKRISRALVNEILRQDEALAGLDYARKADEEGR